MVEVAERLRRDFGAVITERYPEGNLRGRQGVPGGSVSARRPSCSFDAQAARLPGRPVRRGPVTLGCLSRIRPGVGSPAIRGLAAWRRLWRGLAPGFAGGTPKVPAHPSEPGLPQAAVAITPHRRAQPLCYPAIARWCGSTAGDWSNVTGGVSEQALGIMGSCIDPVVCSGPSNSRGLAGGGTWHREVWLRIAGISLLGFLVADVVFAFGMFRYRGWEKGWPFGLSEHLVFAAACGFGVFCVSGNAGGPLSGRPLTCPSPTTGLASRRGRAVYVTWLSCSCISSPRG